jgi:hypothetical protein
VTEQLSCPYPDSLPEASVPHPDASEQLSWSHPDASRSAPLSYQYNPHHTGDLNR